MSRRRIIFCQNVILFILIVFCISMHMLEEAKLAKLSKIARINPITKKLIVSDSLKDCLKSNASAELRAAVKDMKAPNGQETTLMSFINHYKSLIGDMDINTYQDAYDTLDKCGLGLFASE